MRKEFTLQSNDAMTMLHGYVWTPDGEPKQVLQMVHGMSDHIERYDEFAQYLTTQGFAVIGHNHLGHGESVTSEDRLGYFAKENGHRIVVDDMHKVTEYGRELFPGVPYFILGHSMGSFMVRRYLMVYGGEVDGAIVMGTGFIPRAKASIGVAMPTIVRAFKGEFYRSSLLTYLALGSNNKAFAPNRTDSDWLSRNEENVDLYIEDPWCGFRFTASAYVDFFTVIKSLTSKKNLELMPKEMPILIISGAVDPVGGEKAVMKLKAQYDALGMKDVTVKLYPEDRHEILREVDRVTVFEDIKNWLEAKRTK